MKRRRLRTESLKTPTMGGAAAIAADTSSSAAATIPVVGTAAAALAALIIEPIFAKSVTAAVIISGAVITYDIPHLRAARDNPVAGWRLVLHRSYAESKPPRGLI
jgi:hypothetical protein